MTGHSPGLRADFLTAVLTWAACACPIRGQPNGHGSLIEIPVWCIVIRRLHNAASWRVAMSACPCFKPVTSWLKKAGSLDECPFRGLEMTGHLLGFQGLATYPPGSESCARHTRSFMHPVWPTIPGLLLSAHDTMPPASIHARHRHAGLHPTDARSAGRAFHTIPNPSMMR